MKNKSKIEGAGASIICMLLLLLFMAFYYIDKPDREEEEGIMVSFGNAEQGGGDPTVTPANAQPVSVSPPAQAQAPTNNDMLAQDDESIALEKQRKEEDKKKKAEEQERIRKQKEEQARLEAERLAKEKALAEQRAKEQAAIEKANQLGGLFGQAGNNSGSNGSEASSSDKGNPVGKGSSGGNSWSLSGRSLLGNIGKPTLPPGKQSGKVVVEIRVNANGKVVSAKQAPGTTISETETIRACINKAYSVIFSKGDSDSMGSITFNITTN